MTDTGYCPLCRYITPYFTFGLTSFLRTAENLAATHSPFSVVCSHTCIPQMSWPLFTLSVWASRSILSCVLFPIASIDKGRHGFSGPKPSPDCVLSPCLTPVRLRRQPCRERLGLPQNSFGPQRAPKGGMARPQGAGLLT